MATEEEVSIYERPPLYVVLFSTNEDLSFQSLPVKFEQLRATDQVTVPHAIARDMAQALPGLWYCLHLPNTFQHLHDIPVKYLKSFQKLHLDHNIILTPIQTFSDQYFGELLDQQTAVLAVCPDSLLEEAEARAQKLHSSLPVAAYSQLSDSSLEKHWREMSVRFAPNVPYFGYSPSLASRLDVATTDLPRRLLEREMSPVRRATPAQPENSINTAGHLQILLAALARLEREGRTPAEADRELEHVMLEEAHTMQLPVVIGLPGVSSTYSRKAYSKPLLKRVRPFASLDERDTWTVATEDRPDDLIERSAIEFCVTHQAIARSSMGLMLPSVPQEAFTILAQLEEHCTGNVHGPTVWRLLERINGIMAPIWTEDVVAAVSRASQLIAFTNFPIGLCKLPGDSAPLLDRVPISYKPILPLTTTIQRELSANRSVDLSRGIRIFVAECIFADDPVGQISREAWKTVSTSEGYKDLPLTITVGETLNVDDLRAEIAERRPDILVISAHGKIDVRQNFAGLLVGDELCLGPELGSLPPVVVLSACHVAPRGASVVTITDLLLRQGAVAVLGTQVPVNVVHNAVLMARFFVYLAEVMAGREDHSTMLEIWHRVQSSNAINDIANGSPQLRSWILNKQSSGDSVLAEFMATRSVERLRLQGAYLDTETVLAEIADEQGMGDRVRNWFRSPGYMPESLFYVFAGKPESIYVKAREIT
ncbi:CHAT domain-containing protein [Actinophytocola sp.]|uniref:CHAT domain-containing protein n=1 Tax=Actinophytocola sp. TaxID=1872138 RepID=UPI003899B93D